jgi:hypothetical protein
MWTPPLSTRTFSTVNIHMSLSTVRNVIINIINMRSHLYAYKLSYIAIWLLYNVLLSEYLIDNTVHFVSMVLLEK